MSSPSPRPTQRRMPQPRGPRPTGTSRGIVIDAIGEVGVPVAPIEIKVETLRGVGFRLADRPR